MDERDFMRRAIELSAGSTPETGDQPFGCVVVKDGRIVGEGRNRVSSSLDPSAHGEIVAIRDACARLGTRDLSGCDLFTSCEPCPMCVGAIWWSRISRIFYAISVDESAPYGFTLGALPAEIGRPIGERQLPSTQLMSDEALPVMETWHRSTQKPGS